MTRRTFLAAATAAATAASPVPAVFAAPASAPGRVKVALLGIAHSHAAGKLAALRRLTDLYEVVAVAEPDPKRKAAAAARPEYAGLTWLTEEQVLNLPGLHAVLVETDVASQGMTALRGAKAGLHVHLEKPGGPSLPVFGQLLDALAANKRRLQMGYMFRGNPAFTLAFRAAREGWLGRVFEVTGIIGKVVGAAERRQTAEFSGGMMFELGSHLIDAVAAVLGKPQKVHAHLRRTRPEQDSLADNTLAVLEYPDALATVRSSAIDVEGGPRRQFHVCGDAGAASILPLEPPRMTLTLTRERPPHRRGTHPVELPPMPGRYDQQLADFARIILGRKELDFTPEHDLAVLDTVLRASEMPLA